MGISWGLLQLHMISNRTRIEKQILLGRQATRALSQSRSIPPKPRLMRQSQERNSERRSTLLSTSSGSEKPISVDPDPEDAFPHGSRWSYDRGRKKRTQYATTEPVQEAGHDPLPSMQVHRKWTQDLLSPVEESDAEGIKVIHLERRMSRDLARQPSSRTTSGATDPHRRIPLRNSDTFTILIGSWIIHHQKRNRNLNVFGCHWPVTRCIILLSKYFYSPLFSPDILNRRCKEILLSHWVSHWVTRLWLTDG